MVTIVIDSEFVGDIESSSGNLEDYIITYDLLHHIGTFPQVAHYDISVLVSLICPDGTLQGYLQSTPPGGNTILNLKGVQNVDPVELREGAIELIQGRMFTEVELETLSNVAIVSENFARTNNLGIGSVMALESIAWASPDIWHVMEFASEINSPEDDVVYRRSYNLEIIGIYNSLVEFNTGDTFWDGQLQILAENTIYVPNTVAINIDNWHTEHMAKAQPDHPIFADENNFEGLHIFENIFTLNDIGELNAFRQAVEEVAPPGVVVIDPVENSVSVNSATGALSDLGNAVLVVAAIAAILILSTLIILFMRERRKEIGIYLALGENRAKIAMQIFAEIMIVAFAAITLSLIVGNALADNISQEMLQSELIVDQTGLGGRVYWESSLRSLGVTPGFVADEIFAAYDTSITIAIALAFYAIATVVVFVSTIIPMFYILRLNPRRVMM